SPNKEAIFNMQFSAEEIKAIALALLGAPNQSLSNGSELRFGTHGSISVSLIKSSWYDHEAKEGGGMLAFIQRQLELESDDEAIAWIEANGIKSKANGEDPFKRNFTFKKTNNRSKDARIWVYTDDNGQPLFEVVRQESSEW